MKRFVLTAIATAVAVATTQLTAMIPDQVKIDSGLLAGTASGQPTVRVFKGIPFAAPPLAENRWKAPQPVAKWEGVRKADAFGAPCAAGMNCRKWWTQFQGACDELQERRGGVRGRRIGNGTVVIPAKARSCPEQILKS